MSYDEIKNVLSVVTEPGEKLEMVMDIGAHMSSVPEGAVCNEISGCASRVEICRDGNRFYGTADSALVRGVVAIIVSMVDGKTPDEIRQMDLYGMKNMTLDTIILKIVHMIMLRLMKKINNS